MKLRFVYVILSLLALTTTVRAQEESPFISYDVPSQNLLKFNRFLINPTFSTVREDKSYINLLHRNQSVSFDDNNQTYFLSYSGRMNDRTGLGISLYTQTEGVLRNYGVLANYAYGVKLSDKSNFTFGANLSYYNSGLDQNRINTVEDDPFIGGFQDSSLLSFQPGFNISYGNWDFGMFAENLFDYNLKTNESITEFKDKTYSGHLQYTHQFKNDAGILEGGRLMPLARARKVGEEEFVLGGNLILDLPKLGWLQGGYDSFYGASAGIGFNLNRRLSIGYTMEKGLSSNFDNFGLTHEISFAYSITPNLTEDRVMLEDFEDTLVSNEDEDAQDELSASEKDAEIEELKRRLAENDAILAELIYRQDSLEQNQQRDLEDRFEMVMRMVRRETGGKRADVEEKARDLYFNPQGKDALAERKEQADEAQEKDLLDLKKQKEEVVQTYQKEEVTPEVTRDRTEIAEAPKKVKPAGVKSRKFRDLEGVTDGYYVVANVYKGEFYLNKFVDKLNEEGYDADYIDNPNNGLKYVYLKRYNTWKEAKEAYETRMGGAYDGDLWIMNVQNRYTNEAYVENSRKVEEKSSRYGQDVLRQNVVVRDNVGEAQQPKTYEIAGVGGGFYIIANVFANPKNANRFVKLLNAQGLSASYFINPENNYRYVYLRKHESWNNALISYYSNLNDAYNDKMWIMRVTPNLIT